MSHFLHLVRPHAVIQTTVFLHVASCSVAQQYQCCRETFYFHKGRILRQQAPLPGPLSTRLHHVTSHNTATFPLIFFFFPLLLFFFFFFFFSSSSSSSFFCLKSLTSQKMVCSGIDHNNILHNFVQHFVTADCEQEVHELN